MRTKKLFLFSYFCPRENKRKKKKKRKEKENRKKREKKIFHYFPQHLPSLADFQILPRGREGEKKLEEFKKKLFFLFFFFLFPFFFVLLYTHTNKE